MIYDKYVTTNKSGFYDIYTAPLLLFYQYGQKNNYFRSLYLFWGTDLNPSGLGLRGKSVLGYFGP